jgi:glycerophosphoryl diester phosphodiesterase
VDLSRLMSLSEIAVIAHRGGSKLRPENTLASFDHALSLGVDALECDVHLSRDGEPVVIHDFTLERTTDATGAVSALSADELAQVDAAFHFGAADGFPYRGQGHGVPRLATLFDRYPATPIVVEIKGDRPEVAEAALAVVREARALDRVIFGGFSRVVLDTLRRLVPQVPTSASRDEIQEVLEGGASWRPRRPVGYRIVQAPFRLEGRQIFGLDFVSALRAAGLPVQSWIIDEVDDMQRLLGWGVTGLISDRPDRAVELVRQSSRSGTA